MKTSPEFEAFLARVYVDAEFRARFLTDPIGEAQRAGLSDDEGAALDRMDRSSLQLASRSYQAKRSNMVSPRRTGWFRRLLQR